MMDLRNILKFCSGLSLSGCTVPCLHHEAHLCSGQGNRWSGVNCVSAISQWHKLESCMPPLDVGILMYRSGIFDSGPLRSLPALLTWHHAFLDWLFQILANLFKTYELMLIFFGLNCHALLTSLIRAVLLMLKAQFHHHPVCKCSLFLTLPPRLNQLVTILALCSWSLYNDPIIWHLVENLEAGTVSVI